MPSAAPRAASKGIKAATAAAIGTKYKKTAPKPALKPQLKQALDAHASKRVQIQQWIKAHKLALALCTAAVVVCVPVNLIPSASDVPVHSVEGVQGPWYACQVVWEDAAMPPKHRPTCVFSTTLWQLPGQATNTRGLM
jgi:hypothetical protein